MSVNAVVPKRIPNDARADICQELLLAILDGDLKLEDLIKAVKPAVQKRLEMFSRFKTSLDQPIFGTDDGEGKPLTLLETIPHDYEPIYFKYMRKP